MVAWHHWASTTPQFAALSAIVAHPPRRPVSASAGPLAELRVAQFTAMHRARPEPSASSRWAVELVVAVQVSYSRACLGLFAVEGARPASVSEAPFSIPFSI